MVFNVKAFWERLSAMKMGSGTLADRTGVHPDRIQGMIHTTECSDEDGEKLLKLLGPDILEVLPIGEYSLKQIRARVESGEWDIAEILEKEKAREHPRKGLLEFADECMAPGPEMIEENMEEDDEMEG